ncbi:MAG: glycerol acyltransferase [Mucilaginibacter sp.]|nr:glycerol acyltransferase [Mucilaginibacter sp.]
MIYPQKNNIIQGLLRYYIKWIIRRNFHAVNFNTIEIDQNKGVLLLANHFSWWDGFIWYYINTKLFKKKPYVMILEETMQSVPFFKYLGGFSVNKKLHEMLASLDYAAQLLNDPQNIVLLFPQGKLYSNFINDVHFEKGVIKIMERAKGKFQLVYAATFIENFQYKKPTVNVYLSRDTIGTFENIEALTRNYQQHYNAAKQLQTKIVL